MKRVTVAGALVMVAALSLPAEAQHGGTGGHLAPVQRNVEVVGKLDLFKGNEQPGRIADVAVFGEYAYLGAFASPNCEDPGVYVIDISDPTAPKEVDFIPTSDPSSFVGEGVQVLDMNTQFYKGPLLLYSQETCLPNGGPVLGSDPRLGAAGQGGATLVDVKDPLNWRKLAENVGDEDPPPPGGIPSGVPHNSHSVFGWQQGDKAYMIVMDNGESGDTDIDIFDITNPTAPRLLLETGMGDWPRVDCAPGDDANCPSVIEEVPPPNGSSPFIHDFVVQKVGDRWLLLASYWDGGYVIVDVTGLPSDVTYLRDTDFGPEPFASELGLPADTPAEGNGHQAEFNFDGSMFIGADEDFNADRFLGEITSGTYNGGSFSALEGSDTPPVDPETGLSGPTVFVGGACGVSPPAPTPDHVALIDRDPGCTFTAKVNSADAAGYKAALIFNNQTTDAPNCDALINMLAVGNIPSLSIARSTALKLMNTDPDPNSNGTSCDTPTPPIGTPSGTFSIKVLFDGWGYLHLYDANTMQALDHWALPESLYESMARDFGDLTVHEVAMDPKQNRAYVSHYSGGFRVVDFSREGGLLEVGAYIAPGGSNLWGVQVHDLGGKTGQVVLASDRDAGLWIFKFLGGDAGGVQCRGETATVFAEPGTHVLKGSPGADVIVSADGSHTVRAGKGRDIVCGGRGKDTIRGGGRNDFLKGGRGQAVRVGGPGRRDICRGGKGRDQFRGCEVERG